MTDLKPCPFCGKAERLEVDTAEWFGQYAGWRVKCDSCESYGPNLDGKDLAIDAWNTRHPHNKGGREC